MRASFDQEEISEQLPRAGIGDGRAGQSSCGQTLLALNTAETLPSLRFR